MVLAVLLAGDADVGAFLPIHDVAENAESLDQLRPVDVAWQSYRAKISSLTKWSRITRGASIVSSK